MKVRLSAEADADIRRLISQGLEQFGPVQVSAYLDGLEATFRALGEHPLLGKARAEFRLPYRTYTYQAHIIFYRIDDDGILITRIRHGREDWLAE